MDFVNTAPAQNPIGDWASMYSVGFSGARPGDPGTYQDASGTWYNASGQQISFTNTAPNPGPPQLPPVGAPGGGTTTDTGTGGTPAPVPPYQGGQYANPAYGSGPTLTTPQLPAELQTPFSLPSYDAFVNANPQFETGLKTALQGVDRSAAAQGSLLSGGQLKAATKFATDYGSSHYQDYVNNLLQQRNTNMSEYLANAGLAANTFSANQAAYQNQVQDALAQFGTNYNQYLDLINNNRTASNDYWSRLMDVTNAGIRSATAAQPPPNS
jgi:hypothetical protein